MIAAKLEARYSSHLDCRGRSGSRCAADTLGRNGRLGAVRSQPIRRSAYKRHEAAMKIRNPLIELLAIKLFEHDSVGGEAPKTPNLGWMALPDSDRKLFRDMAAGKVAIPTN
jgi:hypothetical protein